MVFLSSCEMNKSLKSLYEINDTLEATNHLISCILEYEGLRNVSSLKVLLWLLEGLNFKETSVLNIHQIWVWLNYLLSVSEMIQLSLQGN